METNLTLEGVQIVSLLVGVILPVLVGLVTKRVTSAKVKSLLLLFLSAVSGFLTELLSAMQNNQTFLLDQALLTWASTFIVAVAIHYGLWKPTGVTEVVQGSVVK